MCKWKYLNWQHYFVRIFTFCIFVEVRNIYTLIWADSLGADAVNHSTLVNPNHSESRVIAVHLQIKRAKYIVLTPTK